MYRSIAALWSKLWLAAKSFWHAHPRITLGVVAVIIVVGIAISLSHGNTTATEITPAPHHVDLLSVTSYKQSGGSAGVGSPLHESVLRSEVGGMVAQVVPVGSHVAAGQVIAQLSNDSQRAALLQSQGALDSAVASQQKVLEGTRTEQRDILSASYDSAKNSAISALLTAYSSADSAVRNTADQMINGPETTTPTLVFNTTNSSREATLINMRTALVPILKREKTTSNTLSSSDDLAAEITTTESELRAAYDFIDTLVASLNEAIPTTAVSATQIATYKSAAISARASLTTALSALTTSQNSLVSAQKSLEQANNGAQNVDVSSAAAGVKQSQGAYDSALASYDKTIIRARTAGTVTACSAKVGDVIGVGNDVCRVASSEADLGLRFALPLSAVKYTPVGAYVFTLTSTNTIHAIAVEAGLVTADKIVVYGLKGDEQIVSDVRGIKEGDSVTTQ